MICGRSFRAQHALSGRSNGDPSAHGRGSDIPRAHDNRRFAHRLRTRESALRNRGHCALYIAVRIRNVRDVRCGLVDDGCVVYVRDRDVGDGRIADIDPVHVLRTDVIGRHKYFART